MNSAVNVSGVVYMGILGIISLVEKVYSVFETKTPEQKQRGVKLLEKVANNVPGLPLPRSLCLLPYALQIPGVHTYIRKKDTPSNGFIFYSKRLIRITIEYALSLLPFKDVTVETAQGTKYKICGVSILPSGETMEQAVCDICKDILIVKLFLQTNSITGKPELYSLRAPNDIKTYKVILMVATVATGAAAKTAIKEILDLDVKEENIMIVSLLMAEVGARSIANAFPQVTMVTSAVDPDINSCNKFKVMYEKRTETTRQRYRKRRPFHFRKDNTIMNYQRELEAMISCNSKLLQSQLKKQNIKKGFNQFNKFKYFKTNFKLFPKENPYDNPVPSTSTATPQYSPRCNCLNNLSDSEYDSE